MTGNIDSTFNGSYYSVKIYGGNNLYRTLVSNYGIGVLHNDSVVHIENFLLSSSSGIQGNVIAIFIDAAIRTKYGYGEIGEVK